MGTKKRILSGCKPTGELHLANYVSVIRPAVEFSQDPAQEVILMCADWHGLTNKENIKESGSQTRGILAAYLAMGFSLQHSHIIVQSHFPEILQVAWHLACASGIGLLERAHAYKDAVANGKVPTAGLFYYPVLMAADIVTFDATCVPVGKDQAQHLEYASDMVKSFNSVVGKDIFKEPQPLFVTEQLIMGLDGHRKMSKSYKNTLPLFAPPKDIERKIKDIVTDSKGLNEPKDPNTCAVYLLLKAFGSQEAIDHMDKSLSEGKGYGYGHAKKDFYDEFMKVFGNKREAFEHYKNSAHELDLILKACYERVHPYAQQVVQRAQDVLNLVGRLS